MRLWDAVHIRNLDLKSLWSGAPGGGAPLLETGMSRLPAGVFAIARLTLASLTLASLPGAGWSMPDTPPRDQTTDPVPAAPPSRDRAAAPVAAPGPVAEAARASAAPGPDASPPSPANPTLLVPAGPPNPGEIPRADAPSAPRTSPRVAPTDRSPSPGLVMEATGSLPDAGPGHGRSPGAGAYAPYQGLPPLLGQDQPQDLEASAVRKSLQARGFSDIGPLTLRGRTFLCEATGPRRERVRLVVDAASGAISGLQVIGYERRD